MTPGLRRSDAPTGRGGIDRCRPALRVRVLRVPWRAGLLAAAALFPLEALGLPISEGFQERAGHQGLPRVQVDDPCTEDFGDLLRRAEALANEGEPDPAAALLERPLEQCPDHPKLLAGLGGLRVLQGDLPQAEALAARLVGIRPGSNYAWELLALTLYLQDDTYGALRAWSRANRPVVGEVNVRVLGHDGPRASRAGPDPDRLSGVAEGQILTVERMVLGERRLGALPAAARARLEYRIRPEGEASVDGTVVLGTDNPFTRPELVAHALRVLGRRVHLVSADPLGRLERWALSGTMEGTLHKAGLSLAHPAPGGPGVWGWELDHETGRYGSSGLADAARETSTSLQWSHTDWVTATLRGSGHTRVDVRPERGTFVGAGTGWTFLPGTGRGAIGAEGAAWVRVGGGSPAGGGPETEARFGRTQIRGSFQAMRPREGRSRTGRDGPADGRGGRGVGLELRGGVVAVSQGIPPDLMPRIGSSGNAALPMRAHSDLDDRGVIRPLFPGTAWAHGGIEVLRPIAAVGPVGIGVALFADGVKVLSPERKSATSTNRRGAVHLGGGLRARIPWVDGGLRVDWGIDPSDGASTFSAGWVRDHRLLRLSAY